MNRLTGYDQVKVFTATKAREREQLGDKITDWIHNHPEDVQVVDTVVRQSSDSQFHCLSIIVFYNTEEAEFID